VDSRRWELEKKYHRLIWKHFLMFFTYPTIWQPMLMFLFCFWFLKTLSFAPMLFTIGIIALTIFSFYLIITNRKKQLKEDKKWLFQEIILSYGGVICFSTVPFQIMFRLTSNEIIFENNWITTGVSFFLISYGILNYIIYKIIPGKAQQYLKETYPEYQITE
jgi:hypothetical protein